MYFKKIAVEHPVIIILNNSEACKMKDEIDLLFPDPDEFGEIETISPTIYQFLSGIRQYCYKK